MDAAASKALLAIFKLHPSNYNTSLEFGEAKTIPATSQAALPKSWMWHFGAHHADKQITAKQTPATESGSISIDTSLEYCPNSRKKSGMPSSDAPSFGAGRCSGEVPGPQCEAARSRRSFHIGIGLRLQVPRRQGSRGSSLPEDW
jgi:hypothetical protein